MSKAKQHDIGAYLKVGRGSLGSTGAGTVDGPYIDRSGFLSALIFAMTGSASGSTVTVQLRDADDDAAANEDDYGDPIELVGSDGVAKGSVDLAGAKRYIRVRTVVAGATAVLGTGVILGGADMNPVSQS